MQAYSMDRLAYKVVGLDLIDGQVYIPRLVNVTVTTATPLPDNLNQYIIDTVF